VKTFEYPRCKRGISTLYFTNMTTTPAQTEQPDVRQRVQNVINLIRPAVQADGGDIELVDVKSDGMVHIRFHGACHGCPSSTMTLQMGIERNLREKVPEVTGVIPVQ
jgi:Fe-S cluster biogenesis protein NfuA